MAWPLFLSFRQLFPPRKFPVFATVSILGVALGVAALLIVQTVMFSFGEEHRRRIREAAGDVVIASKYGEAFPYSAGMAKAVAGVPGVKAATPQIEGPAIILPPGTELSESFDTRNIITLRGVDPDREATTSSLAAYIEDGKLADLDDDGVLIGRSLAYRLMLYPGAKITLEEPKRAIKTAFGENKKYLPLELTIAGLIHSGYDDVDSNVAVVTLRTARKLRMLGSDRVTSVRLKIDDRDNAAAVAEAERRALPDDMVARPWFMLRREFLNAVAMEKQMLFLLMFIITLVASFSIGSTLFSHVVRRNREIGLLGALGAKPRHILGLYVSQGFIVGLFGYIIGVGLTFLILTFRQEIIALIGAQDTMLKQYKFDHVPLYYSPRDFLNAAVLTLGLMTVAALIPAVWASRRKPSEAMRDA